PAELLLVRDGNGRPYRMLEPPAGIIARQAAVLILLYPTGADLHIPLTIRSHHLPNHRGEISLPGGAIDPTDQNPAEAALREANEEIGLDPQVVEIWRMLAPIYTAP
ncbi:MAG TPA: CoA pyrophosphatase, partial [Roseiflexaceae bacterium]|nr:CoA pyrophosphatase [Roseiflexaceae bacterium]